MNELHLFAGAGGGILGGMLLGHTCVCAVEIEPYPREVLLQRQRDGILPKFPIWDDIKTFDGSPWRGLVDVVCGGFPCQDISCGGPGTGIEGERSGLWSEMARVICQVRPRHLFVENSPMLAVRGLGTVLRDMAKMGYDARWGVFSAKESGLLQERARMFIYAHNNEGSNYRKGTTTIPSVIKRSNAENGKNWKRIWSELESLGIAQRANSYSEGRRIFYEFPSGLDRLAAIGNAQVPIVAATAWNILTQ